MLDEPDGGVDESIADIINNLRTVHNGVIFVSLHNETSINRIKFTDELHFANGMITHCKVSQ
jgi:Fe-S cluster assembly ATPase SufC